MLFPLDYAGAEEPATQPGQVPLMSLWPFFFSLAWLPVRGAAPTMTESPLALSAIPTSPPAGLVPPFPPLLSSILPPQKRFLFCRQIYLIFGRCRCEEVGRRSCRGCHQPLKTKRSSEELGNLLRQEKVSRRRPKWSRSRRLPPSSPSSHRCLRLRPRPALRCAPSITSRLVPRRLAPSRLTRFDMRDAQIPHRLLALSPNIG